LYRFEDENVLWLAEHFLLDTGETRGGCLSVKQQMEVFLRHVGDPGFQSGVAEDKGIHQSTVCKTFSKVLKQIVAKANLWIKFPSTLADIRISQQLWQENFEMPGAIGALDCTHVKIWKPGGRRAYGDEYINRKGVASINVQASCDAQERFTSIDANWPGSVHDSRIWKNSDVGRLMANSRGDGHLLGDEGYGVAPWLMTPYGNPVQPHERTFNRIHKKERAVIERCFGQQKKRFPILQGQVRLRIQKVPSVVVACCVLHNAAKYLNDRQTCLP
jgi:hypothetical protein